MKRSTSIHPLPTYPHTCEVLLESDKGSFLISILPAAKMACGNVLDIAAATDACPTFTLWCESEVSSTFSFCTIISDCSLEGLQKLVTMQICILKVEWSSTYFDLIVVLLKQIIVFMNRGGPSSQRAAAFVQRNPGYDLFAPWVLYSSVPQVVTHKFRGGKLRVGDLGVLIH